MDAQPQNFTTSSCASANRLDVDWKTALIRGAWLEKDQVWIFFQPFCTSVTPVNSVGKKTSSLCSTWSMKNSVEKQVDLFTTLTAYFRIIFGFIFKASPGPHPFIRLQVFIHIQIKLIFIWMVEYQASSWNRAQRCLRNGRLSKRKQLPIHLRLIICGRSRASIGWVRLTWKQLNFTKWFCVGSVLFTW